LEPVSSTRTSVSYQTEEKGAAKETEATSVKDAQRKEAVR